MMTSLIVLTLVAVGGAGLALFFFGGLWLTVGRLRHTAHPGLVLLGSFAVRAAITLAGLAFLTEGRLDRVAAALVGFSLTRLVLLRAGRPLSPVPVPKRGSHANQSH